MLIDGKLKIILGYIMNYLIKNIIRKNIYVILLFLMIFTPDLNYFRLEDLLVLALVLYIIFNKREKMNKNNVLREKYINKSEKEVEKYNLNKITKEYMKMIPEIFEGEIYNNK